MSEVLLSQITASVLEVHEVQIRCIALGFVNLGKGDDLRGLNDEFIVIDFSFSYEGITIQFKNQQANGIGIHILEN